MAEISPASGGVGATPLAPILSDASGNDVVKAYNVDGDAVATDSVSHHGGPIIQDAQLQLIFWGSEWNTLTVPSKDDVVSAISKLTTSTYLDSLRQYGFRSLHMRDAIVIQNDPPAEFVGKDANTLVWNLLNDRVFENPGSPNGNILYLVMMPSRSHYAGKDPAGGAHGDVVASDVEAGYSGRAPFAWIGYGSLDFISKVSSHEIHEAITDPVPENAAWLMNRSFPPERPHENEIGDACDNTSDYLDGVFVQAYWSQDNRACVIPFPPAPTVTSIWPPYGAPEGGTRIEIHGTNFYTDGNTQVSFNGLPVPVTSVTCPSTTECDVTTPPGDGIADVSVSTNLTTGEVTADTKFAYVPSVLGIEPSTAKPGDWVTIHGIGLGRGMTVKFGEWEATAPNCYPGPDCTVTVPPGSGVVDVRVWAGGSVSAINMSDKFRYPMPSIDRITPNSGSIEGGTYVNIYGYGFDPAAGTNKQMHVRFNDVETDYVSCNSTTSCTVRSPASNVYGPVHITFDAYGASSSPTSNDLFLYVPAALTKFSYSYFDHQMYFGLNGKAPAGGISVELTSSNPNVVKVPATISVPAGYTAYTVPVTLIATDHSDTVTITARSGGSTFTAAVPVWAGPPVIVRSPSVLAARESGTVTVGLAAPAPAEGAEVELTSSDPLAIAVPQTVFVAAGEHQAQFTITNQYDGAAKTVTLTATYAGSSGTDTVDVPRVWECPAKHCPRGQYWHPDICACSSDLPE